MKSAIKDTLPTMYALAKERSELSRIHLASMLADVFLSPDLDLSLREQEMVNELIDQLMHDSTPKVRQQLVEKFVDLERMPHRIATNLAQDNIDIARTVLVSSPVLQDEDLVRIVETKGGDHAVAVATRSKISEAVADALVTTGDVRVMQVVAENLGAHLSHNAVDIVADAARYTVDLRKPLIHRVEMHADAAMRLYWWVEQDLRRIILKRFGVTTGQIDQSLSDTISSFLNAHAFEKANDEVMSQVADWMEAHQATTPQVLPQILRLGHFRLFNIVLGRLTHLTVKLIDRIMEEVGGRGLAAISRAIGIDKAGFVSLFLLSRGGRPGEQIVHPHELSDALATYDRMTPAKAQDLLNSWNANPDYFAKLRDTEHADDTRG